MNTLLSTMLFIGGLGLGLVTLFVGAMRGVWPFGEGHSAGPILFGAAVLLAVVYLAVVGCLQKGKARTVETWGWLLIAIVSALAVVTGIGTLNLAEPNTFIGRSQLIIGSVIGILALLQIVLAAKSGPATNH